MFLPRFWRGLSLLRRIMLRKHWCPAWCWGVYPRWGISPYCFQSSLGSRGGMIHKNLKVIGRGAMAYMSCFRKVSGLYDCLTEGMTKRGIVRSEMDKAEQRSTNQIFTCETFQSLCSSWDSKIVIWHQYCAGILYIRKFVTTKRPIISQSHSACCLGGSSCSCSSSFSFLILESPNSNHHCLRDCGEPLSWPFRNQLEGARCGLTTRAVPIRSK